MIKLRWEFGGSDCLHKKICHKYIALRSKSRKWSIDLMHLLYIS